jgi:hypothetical protein
MAKSAASFVSSTNRYNPKSAVGDLEQVFAANWELLRRVPAFQAIAKQWSENEKFRLQHVGERAVYKDNVFARCALDWMLTSKQRFRLAKHQMQHRLFFWDQTANFGPIIVEKRLERLTAGLRECIDDLVKVKPDPNSGGVLHLGQTWPCTPLKFRSQFASVFDSDDLATIELGEPGLILTRVGNMLLKGKSVSSEEQAALGRYLFQLGENFVRVSRELKIAAIRRHHFYSERRVDEILRRIKESLPYQPRTGNDLDTKRSFLGTPDQWNKFLAWEAHDYNAYRAAAEFAPKWARKAKRRIGDPSRSERQRDIAGSIRKAVKAIQQWFPKIYPVRNLQPASLRRPKA